MLVLQICIQLYSILSTPVLQLQEPFWAQMIFSQSWPYSRWLTSSMINQKQPFYQGDHWWYKYNKGNNTDPSLDPCGTPMLILSEIAYEIYISLLYSIFTSRPIPRTVTAVLVTFPLSTGMTLSNSKVHLLLAYPSYKV